MSSERVGLVVRTDGGPGVLHQLTGVIARHQGDITSVEILENRPRRAGIYFEIDVPAAAADPGRGPARRCPSCGGSRWSRRSRRSTASGSSSWAAGPRWARSRSAPISEADRHNIRGEHISVDTIPLVGEQPLADAVRAVARLPRARALVLAGALMGGDIEQAVREVRAQGLLVISLNMAGSVPEAADLVVDRSRPGRRHGGDGGGRDRQFRRRAAE